MSWMWIIIWFSIGVFCGVFGVLIIALFASKSSEVEKLRDKAGIEEKSKLNLKKPV